MKKYLVYSLFGVSALVASENSQQQAAGVVQLAPPPLVINAEVLRSNEIAADFRLVEKPVRKVADADLWSHLAAAPKKEEKK